MTEEAKPWISLKFDFDKEESKKFNAQLDKVASALGYALVGPSNQVYTVDTFDNCQKALQVFLDMDEKLGLHGRSDDMEIIPVDQIHWKTRRSAIIEKMEDTFNDNYASGDPTTVKAVERLQITEQDT
jgi:hypothetical protein